MIKKKGLILLLCCEVMLPSVYGAEKSTASHTVTATDVQEDIEQSEVNGVIFQGETASDALEQVIKTVKEQITIPEAFSRFEYSESETTYHLQWYSEAGCCIRVTCDPEGRVLQYYYFDENDHTIASVNYNQAKKAADEFLRKVAPHYVEYLKVKENPKNNDASRSYKLEYEFVKEGLKLVDTKVSVEVSKTTGEVTAFSGIRYEEDVQFEKPTPKINEEQAITAYLKEIGVTLAYRLYEDDAQNQKSFLAYGISNNMCQGISAQNGSLLKQVGSDFSNYGSGADEISMDMGTAEFSSVNAKQIELTPQEQEKVTMRKDFMSIDAIVKKACTYFPILKQMKVERQNIYKETNDYMVALEFVEDDKELDRGASLKVNALTGEIQSYFVYGARRSYEEKKNHAWSLEEAQKWINEVAPEEAKQVEINASCVTKNEEGYETYVFNRKAYDTLVEGNALHVEYDTMIGMVTSYRKSWNDVVIKEPEGALSPTEILRKLGMELGYLETSKGSYQLVYTLKETPYLVDAFTGEEVNYRGEVIPKQDNKGFYTDIKGHPKENIITDLYYSGIYLETKQLKPDEPITKDEMIELVQKALAIYQPILWKDNFGRENGDLEAYLTKDGDETLTQEEGIGMLISETNYESLAKVSTIFTSPYETSERYKGSVAIAYGLGWIGKETFKPKAPLTKAQAMTYLYQMLTQ